MRNLALKAYVWAQLKNTNEEGQTVIEYALVVAIVSVVLAGAMYTFGNDVIVAAQDAVEAVI